MPSSYDSLKTVKFWRFARSGPFSQIRSHMVMSPGSMRNICYVVPDSAHWAFMPILALTQWEDTCSSVPEDAEVAPIPASGCRVWRDSRHCGGRWGYRFQACQCTLGPSVVHLPAQGTKQSWASLLLAKDSGGLKAWIQGVPLDGWVRGDLLPKCPVVVQPPHTTMPLGLLYKQSGIR